MENVKIKGWVARDKDYMLHFFKTKPLKYEEFGEWSNASIRYLIPSELCDELSWRDEPLEVELTIKQT